MPEAVAASSAVTGASRRRDGSSLRPTRAASLRAGRPVPLGAHDDLLKPLIFEEVGRKVAGLLEHRELVRENARLLAGTNRDLTGLVADGRFREDLHYRLNVVRIEVPPLRERLEDVPPLVRHLLRRHAVAAGVPVPAVTPEAMRALCQNPWRGNVRELSNVVERALILADDGRIDLPQLPGDVREAVGLHLDLAEAIDRFERSYIAVALQPCGGSREKAAEELGISPATLYRRLERFGLKGKESSRPAKG